MSRFRRTQFQKAIWPIYRRMRLRLVLGAWLCNYRRMRLFPHQYGKRFHVGIYMSSKLAMTYGANDDNVIFLVCIYTIHISCKNLSVCYTNLKTIQK